MLQTAKVFSYSILMICLLTACYHSSNPFQRSAQLPTSRRTFHFASDGIMPNGVPHRGSRLNLIKKLQRQDIQVVQYGDTMTLIIPTDKYFLVNTPRLNDYCYGGLLNVIRLLKCTPCGPIYVAGFTDNVGSDRHKKRMSRAQAETILTYLWANKIPARVLKAEGYADKHPVADDKLIHGSAQNRRVEVQCVLGSPGPDLPVYK
jgi:outer membrane protein OmpA-like peptidoglycan-associated protein